MENKTFQLTTAQCQLLVIALIHNTVEKDSFAQEHKEQFEELTDLFADLNTMCNEGNDYRLTFEVKA